MSALAGSAGMVTGGCGFIGSQPSPVHGPPDWTAESSRVADIAAIRAALDWTPRFTLAQGLSATWSWLNEEVIP